MSNRISDSEKKKRINHPVLRFVFLCLGLTIMAFGVAFSIKADLGISPISTVPYVTSLISGLSVGTTTIIMNFLFVADPDPAILRRQYDWFQLLTVSGCHRVRHDDRCGGIPAAGILPVSNYGEEWLFCILGIVLIASGHQRGGDGESGHHSRRGYRACHL